MVCLEPPCCSACGNAAAPRAPLVNDMQVPCMAGGGTGQRGPPLLIRCPPGIRGSAGANCATHGLCPPVCDRRQSQVSRGAQLLVPYLPGRPPLRPGNSAGSSFSCTKAVKCALLPLTCPAQIPGGLPPSQLHHPQVLPGGQLSCPLTCLCWQPGMTQWAELPLLPDAQLPITSLPPPLLPHSPTCTQLLETYKQLLARKREQLTQAKQRLESGVDKITLVGRLRPGCGCAFYPVMPVISGTLWLVGWPWQPTRPRVLSAPAGVSSCRGPAEEPPRGADYCGGKEGQNTGAVERMGAAGVPTCLAAQCCRSRVKLPPPMAHGAAGAH